MSNEITKSSSFEDKMKQRVKDSIGDLMSDEDLAKIVRNCIDDIFFKDKIKKDEWGRSIVISKAILPEIVKEIMGPRVDEALKEYMLEHHEEIQKTIKELLEKGAASCFINSIDSIFKNDLMNMESKFYSYINDMIRRN